MAEAAVYRRQGRTGECDGPSLEKADDASSAVTAASSGADQPSGRKPIRFSLAKPKATGGVTATPAAREAQAFLLRSLAAPLIAAPSASVSVEELGRTLAGLSLGAASAADAASEAGTSKCERHAEQGEPAPEPDAGEADRVVEASEGPPMVYPSQVAVLDTNQLLEGLDALQFIVGHLSGVNCIVPLVVLLELEGLQHGKDSRALQARQALRFVQSTVRRAGGRRCDAGSEPSAILLQRQDETVIESLRRALAPNADDQIVACARYFAEEIAPGLTEVLSADKGLVIKAASYGLPSETAAALMSRGAAVLAQCRTQHALGPTGSVEDRRNLVLQAQATVAARSKRS